MSFPTIFFLNFGVSDQLNFYNWQKLYSKMHLMDMRGTYTPQITKNIFWGAHESLSSSPKHGVRGFGRVRIVVRTGCLLAIGEASEVQGRILVGTKK